MPEIWGNWSCQWQVPMNDIKHQEKVKGNKLQQWPATPYSALNHWTDLPLTPVDPCQAHKSSPYYAFEYLKLQIKQTNCQVHLCNHLAAAIPGPCSSSHRWDSRGTAAPSPRGLFPLWLRPALCPEESAAQSRAHPAFKSKLRPPSSGPINSWDLTTCGARRWAPGGRPALGLGVGV